MIWSIINIFQNRVIIKLYLRIMVDELRDFSRVKSIFIWEIIKYNSTFLWSTKIVGEMMNNMILFRLFFAKRMNLYSTLINTRSINSVTKVIPVRCGSKICFIGLSWINIIQKCFSYCTLIVITNCLWIFIVFYLSYAIA